MKLGFVSAILPELGLHEVLEYAADIGYDCVEVMCWPLGKAERRYAGVTHIDISLDFVESVNKAVEETGTSISALGYYPNPLSSDADEAATAQNHIKDVISASADLGIKRMNTFVGRDPKKSVEENWPRFIQIWEPIIAHAESRDVKIGIENCPMLFTNDEWPGGKNLAHSPAVWKKMFEFIPSNHFGLNYDPSHLVWQMMDPIEPLFEFHNRIFHVHAKDARVDRHKLNQVGIMATPLEYHQPKLPGQGEVNWGRFFSVLSDIGYRDAVCVEVEDRAFEHSLEGRKDAVRLAHTYLRQFVSPQGDF